MKILLAIPSYSGTVPLALMQNMLAQKSPAKDTQMHFAYTSGAWIIPARNGLANKAIDLGYDYIFFFDDDQIPEIDTLKKLASLDKDIVGSVIPDRNGECRIAVTDENLDDITHIDKDMKVGYIGMGATLIKTEVLKAVIKEYGEPFAALQTEVNGKLIDMFEDTAFCWRAKQLGYEIWVKHDSVPIHLGRQKSYQYDYKTGKIKLW
jgi:GT2 family glycosyltransferase